MYIKSTLNVFTSFAVNCMSLSQEELFQNLCHVNWRTTVTASFDQNSINIPANITIRTSSFYFKKLCTTQYLFRKQQQRYFLIGMERLKIQDSRFNLEQWLIWIKSIEHCIVKIPKYAKWKYTKNFTRKICQSQSKGRNKYTKKLPKMAQVKT